MVPLSRTAAIGGRPAIEALGADALGAVVQRSRVADLHGLGLMRGAPETASAPQAPASLVDAVRSTLL